MVLGAHLLELARLLGERAAIDTPGVLEVDLRRHVHLIEVGGVAERLELDLRGGVEVSAAGLVVGHGVGEHGPGLAKTQVRGSRHDSFARTRAARTMIDDRRPVFVA